MNSQSAVWSVLTNILSREPHCRHMVSKKLYTEMVRQSLWHCYQHWVLKTAKSTTVNNRHYSGVIMSVMASQLTSLKSVYLAVSSGADQRKHQSSASLAFVRGIHRWPVNSPHKGPVTRKMFPFDDVIMSDNNIHLNKATMVITVTSFLTGVKATIPQTSSDSKAINLSHPVLG